MNKRALIQKMVGYDRRDPGTHRQYSFRRSIQRYKRTGSMKAGYINGGSGHMAGEAWGDKKGIDPSSRQQKYSKNSPSFDEGVYLSKQKRKLASRMISP